jgi:hypothetical protein
MLYRREIIKAVMYIDFKCFWHRGWSHSALYYDPHWIMYIDFCSKEKNTAIHIVKKYQTIFFFFSKLECVA